MSDGSGGNTPGDVIRNILLFLIVAAVLLVGALYIVSKINAEEAGSTEGLGWTTSLVSQL
jgi:hypothetical protein